MKKSTAFIIAHGAVISVLVATIAIGVSLTLYSNHADSNGPSGQISLRSYYEEGEGTSGKPFIITRPRHLYNLSRLQGLGVYGDPTKPVYFELGKVGLGGDTSGRRMCYVDETDTMKPYLDMSNSTYTTNPINAIGSEANPFYGIFDGCNVEIKNLTVFADPEDAGLFGYTAHGSEVKNLFLDEVTIKAFGYTPDFRDLYKEPWVAAVGTSFTYNVGGETPVSDTFSPTVESDTSKVQELTFDAGSFFSWVGEKGTEPASTYNQPAPVITYTFNNNDFNYKVLTSGAFVTVTGARQVSVDLASVFGFFKEKINEDDANVMRYDASSSVSLVASTTDQYGLEHSKVIATLEFDFSLPKGSSDIAMYAHLSEKHTNNIGLIIGHCDGSVDSCYVHNGKFEINDTIQGSTHTSMINGSNLGLIGVVGGTVFNKASDEASAGVTPGKTAGVIDFSTIYDDIITSSSFVNPPTSLNPGVAYTPSSSKKYHSFLRQKGSGANTKYITLRNDTVSFNRQSIINNADLGVFTIATDATGTGMGDDAQNGLDRSVIIKDDPSYLDVISEDNPLTPENEYEAKNRYFVYYATGEYDKNKGISFSEYRDSFSSNNPTEFHPGYHLPHTNEVTSASFEQRDAHQNYIFRFELNPTERKSGYFYFADVDKETPGGSFISKYFENKLIDKDGNKITADSNSVLSGVMIRDGFLLNEIGKLDCSFATPDYSYKSGSAPKMWCVDNDDFNDPAANMINFEITTPYANVTVVAGLEDITKPASLGVYRLDGEYAERGVEGGVPYVNREFEDPDYAFFMPTDDNLAYFDYKVDNEGKGRIGVYENGIFNEITEDPNIDSKFHKGATIAKDFNNGESTDQFYDSGKTRLYAHTFKLPFGRYCLGSATGKNRTDSHKEGIAKIYYVCAQGQTNGQISFNDNTFTGADKVDNIDFTKVARFDAQGEPTITFGLVTEYDPSDSRLENQRCYVSLYDKDRSLFNAAYCNLNFVYNKQDDQFVISSTTTDVISHLAVSNYGRYHGIEDLNNTTIVVLGSSPTDNDSYVYSGSTP